jgi:hypothetical protein
VAGLRRSSALWILRIDFASSRARFEHIATQRPVRLISERGLKREDLSVAGKKTETKKEKAPKTKKTTKKVAASKKSKSSKIAKTVEITAEERWRMIAVAAYHKAEKQDFASGQEMDNWLEAEREVDQLLGKR